MSVFGFVRLCCFVSDFVFLSSPGALGLCVFCLSGPCAPLLLRGLSPVCLFLLVLFGAASLSLFGFGVVWVVLVCFPVGFWLLGPVGFWSPGPFVRRSVCLWPLLSCFLVWVLLCYT